MVVELEEYLQLQDLMERLVVEQVGIIQLLLQLLLELQDRAIQVVEVLETQLLVTLVQVQAVEVEQAAQVSVVEHSLAVLLNS
jgi:hypothetical protein